MVNAAEIVLLSSLCLLASALGAPADDETNVCKDGDTVYKEGQSWTKLGECQKHTCGEYGEVYSKTCAALAVEEGSGWKISKIDLTKRYPQCCPKPIPPRRKPNDKCKTNKNESDDKKNQNSTPDTDGDIVYSVID